MDHTPVDDRRARSKPSLLSFFSSLPAGPLALLLQLVAYECRWGRLFPIRAQPTASALLLNAVRFLVIIVTRHVEAIVVDDGAGTGG